MRWEKGDSALALSTGDFASIKIIEYQSYGQDIGPFFPIPRGGIHLLGDCCDEHSFSRGSLIEAGGIARPFSLMGVNTPPCIGSGRSGTGDCQDESERLDEIGKGHESELNVLLEYSIF
jgi:hypothetical protein